MNESKKYNRTQAYRAGKKYAKSAVTDAEPKKAAAVALKCLKVTAVLAVVLVLTVVFKGNFKKNQKEDDKLEQLRAQAAGETTTEAVGADGILLKYKKAYEKNNDLVGWITVPNTSIDHPVVQAKDNEYYLRKSFYKIYDRRGTIFMDYECNPKELDKNTIIYGHNYLDSTMFSDLEKYKDLDFYKSAPVIDFNTIYKSYKWKVFAVYLINVEPQDDNGYSLYYIYPFMTEDTLEEYLQVIKERSIINTSVDVKKTDKILTLSTCTRDMDLPGHGETNARCVVLARLVRDGESPEVDTSTATLNENPKYPDIWYKANDKTNPYSDDVDSWEPIGVEQ